MPVLVVQDLSGQAYKHFTAEILSAVKNKDGNLLAVTTKDSVFIIRPGTLDIIKKWSHGLSSPVLLGFHPVQENNLLMQRQMIAISDYSGGLSAYGFSPGEVLENYLTTDRKYNELPYDSIYMWDINTQQVVETMPGNFYVQFAQNSLVMVTNEVFTYQHQGKTRNTASTAVITTIKGEQKYESKVKKTCRRLSLSPAEDHFAASFRDGYLNDTLYFSFSVMDFNTHTPVIQIDKLINPTTNFCFSKGGDLLAVAVDWGGVEGGSIKIFDVRKGIQLTEIKGVEEAKDLEFSSTGHDLYYTGKDGNWFTWDLTESRVTQRIWPGLAGLTKTNTAFFLKDRLVVFGEYGIDEIGKPIGSKKLYLMREVPLVDVSLFSKTETTRTESFADSTAYTVILNDVPVSNKTPTLHFSSDKSIFSMVDDNQVQLWETKRRKKLLQLSFEKEIKVFPDKTGNHSLVIEQKGQKSSNEYTLHIVSLGNSIKKTSPVLEASATTMRTWHTSTCNCVPDPVQDALWYCADGSDQVWQVSGNDFSMKPITKISNLSIGQLAITPSGKLYIFGQNETNKNTNDVWVKAKEGKLSRIVSSSSFDRMNIVEDRVWLWNYPSTPELQIWNNEGLEKTLTMPGPIDGIDATANLENAMIQFDVNSKVHIQRFLKGVAQPSQNTGLFSSSFYMLQTDELLAEEKGLASYFNNGAFAIPWSVQTPQVLDIINFDVSANGQFVLFGNRIIDLKEIEQWDIDKFNTAALLYDTGKLNWLEIYRESSWGKQKGGFTLNRFTQGKKDTLISKTWVQEPEKGDNFYYRHNKIITSPDKNWAFTYTLPSSLNERYAKPPPMLWNLKTMTGVVVPKLPENYDAIFSSDSKSLVCNNTYFNVKDITYTITELVYSLEPVKLIQTRKRNSWGRLSSEEDLFVSNGRGVDWLKKDGDSMKIERSYQSLEGAGHVIYDKMSGKIIAASSSGNIFIWDKLGSSSPVAVLHAHGAAIERMLLRNDRVYTLASNGEIGLTDLKTNQFKVQIKTLVKDEELRIAMFTPEGYYRVDPDLINNMHFVKNGELFPLSSFELQGNRPDKVYAAIGFSDTAFINALEQSWRTRLLRAGFNPDMPVDNKERPLISWNRNELTAFTSDPEIKISFSIADRQKDLKTLFIKVNGVPLEGRKGQPFAKGTRNLLLQPIIKLSEGLNNISLVAVNEKGVESLEEIFDIQYSPKVKTKSRLIYIGVGVSSYADSLMNLRYAAKDVEDIGEQIKYYVDSVQVITLVNREATRENILGIKKMLQQTRLEDVVLLSFSGHGMIEKKKGFFFAPYEMDFKDPTARGVSMEMIEDLLDNIPARKRLLLLDACHSGEEWNNFAAAGPLPEGVSATSPRGLKIVGNKNNVTAGNRNSYLLMKELFSDFSRGNGAFMISAAANNEYAFEGETWKNGVFTLSFLESLRKLRKKGSFSSKVPIQVRELRKSIYKNVSELTNGLQNPTSRQENGWWNWSF
ncbi:MAG: caspase family protein [Ferruginibacter sp.]